MYHVKANILSFASIFQLSFGYGQKLLHKNDSKQMYQSLRGFDPISSPKSPIDSSSVVGKSTVTVVGANIFDGKMQVQNEMVVPIDPMYIEVELLDFECSKPMPSNGLEVSLDNYLYSSTPLIYGVKINKDKIGLRASDFVSYKSNTNKSRGNIKFCTRVSIHEDEVRLSYRDTKFEIDFSLSDNKYIVNSVEHDGIGKVKTADHLEESYGVTACQCDDNYVCYDENTKSSISKDEEVAVCITPAPIDSRHSATIENLELHMAAGDIEFSPVSLGTNKWDVVDPLAKVSKLGDTIRVSTPPLKEYFMNGYESLKISGTTILQNGESTELGIFNIGVSLEVESKTESMAKMFRGIKALF